MESWRHSALDIFRPYHLLSRPVIGLLISTQVALGFGLWCLAPAGLWPTPWEVGAAWWQLWAQDGLGVELWTSFSVNLTALFLTMILGLGLAYLSALPVARPVIVGLSKLRFLGLVGLTFFFTLALRDGHRIKVALLVFGIGVFFLTSMADVVASVPQEQLDHARTLRFNEGQVVWEVVILGTAAAALEVFRQSAAMAWMMLSAVEGLVRSQGGIGGLLLSENKHLHLDAVVAIQLTIIGVGLLQDYGLGLMRRTLCPYADLGKTR